MKKMIDKLKSYKEIILFVIVLLVYFGLINIEKLVKATLSFYLIVFTYKSIERYGTLKNNLFYFIGFIIVVLMILLFWSNRYCIFYA